MKVIFPGPAVQGAARELPTLHPQLGRLEVGVNEVLPEKAAAAIAAGLVERVLEPAGDWEVHEAGQRDESAYQAAVADGSITPVEPEAPRRRRARGADEKE